ncbi:MAG: hypothetical protein IPI97_14305 [Nitrosomonas sp.]|nr:hypothetical protein [Nitrosomonas sp.]
MSKETVSDLFKDGKVKKRAAYSDDMPSKAYAMGLLGLSNDQIAEAFGIQRSTLYEWADLNQPLADALSDSREIADSKVALSLWERANGSKVLEVKTYFDEKTGQIVKENVIKEYPPETGAAMAWLKNRQPKLWRERQHDPLTEEGINVNVRIIEGKHPASTGD